MFAAGVVALALNLAAHEAPREVKFGGALLAQADALFEINDDAQQRELNQLIGTRPSLLAPSILLVTGGVLTLGGGVAFIVGVIISYLPGVVIAVVGIVAAASGAILGTIGGVMMSARARAQAAVDERIRRLTAPSALNGDVPGILLARF